MTAGGEGLDRPLELVTRQFFDRDVAQVAPDLLNKVLRKGDCAGRIVEVEAYRGGEDPASHAFRGETARNSVMFGEAGHLYVYFTYGMHYCANVVCGEVGTATAVLVRALAPIAGLEEMRARRPRVRRDVELCSGPGRLCAALDIGRSDNGVDLLDPNSAVQLLDDGCGPPELVLAGPRIGLSERSGAAREWHWRFGVAGEPNLSRGAFAPSGPTVR